MEEKEGLIADRARRAGKKVRECVRKAVGAQIREEKYGDWKDFKQQSKDYKIPMTPDGMELMVWIHKEVTGALYPIGKASGLELVPFVKARVRKFVESIKNNKDWMNETDRLHEEITRKTDKAIIVGIKKK